MDQHLRVAYATDDGYVSLTGISVCSLLENNKDFDEVTVYVLDNGISEPNRQTLSDVVDAYNRRICFLDCSAIGEWLGDDVMSMFQNEKTNVPIASYARLFLPELLDNDVDKILYLDADSIVLGSFKEIWNSDISEYAVLGVLDNVSTAARTNIGLYEEAKYINAGVILLNLDYLRKIDFSQRVKSFIRKYHGHVYHHDQGVINGVLSDKIGILPPQYNLLAFFYEHKKAKMIKELYKIPTFYLEQEFQYAKEHPVFIHFTEGYLQRPWVEHCKHPMKEKWFEYKDKTEWRDMPLKPDARSKKLKLLAWMNLNLPVKMTKAMLSFVAK